jgi:signal transduction histidine kinase
LGDEEGDFLVAALRDVTDQMRSHNALIASEQALQQLNATLESRVQARTSELTETLETLKRAQKELVRSEKLAALGALVAGVAHELNTPIGNAVMVASTLADAERTLSETLEKNASMPALQQFTETAHEACDILLRNLQRAAEQIASFKQVAVDQASYQRRTFTLNEMVDEIAIALTPSLRRSQVSLRPVIPADIVLDSYPGPLGQVLINLINNAVLHAFEGHDDRQVTVQAASQGKRFVKITVGDNGCGIPDAILGRIFDPFFTTRMGQGGTGLGLHITYNLVTGLLGGTITATSSVSQGSQFDMVLPLDAPASAAASSAA